MLRSSFLDSDDDDEMLALKVFLKFFIVSSPSTAGAPPSAGAAASPSLALASPLPASSGPPFLTEELALLTPETVLDSEAVLEKRNKSNFTSTSNYEHYNYLSWIYIPVGNPEKEV